MPPTDQPNEQYARLRAWYLATLRSNAIKDLLGMEGDSLTPATLINADSQLIHKLVKEESSSPTQVTKDAKDNDATIVVSLATILILSAAALPFLLLAP